MDPWTLLKATPFGFGLIAGFLLARRTQAAGSPGRVSFGGGLLLLSGIVLVFLMAAHTVGVPLFRYLDPRRVPPSAGRSFCVAGLRYDYRLYSLVLMGITMLRYALVCVRCAPGVARGERTARRRAWTATGLLVALTAPLIPLSFEAWLYGAVLLLNVLALAVSARMIGPRPVETAPSRARLLSAE